MNKILMLMMALFMLLAVPAAFADEPLEGYVFNQARESRVLNLHITTTSGAGAMPSKTVSASGDAYFEFGGHNSEDQKWEFKITDMSGKSITEATVYYSGGKFSPGTIGEGVAYSTFSDTEFKLQISK